MRAAVYEGIERIVVKDIPIPKISDEEILVRISVVLSSGRISVYITMVIPPLFLPPLPSMNYPESLKK